MRYTKIKVHPYRGTVWAGIIFAILSWSSIGGYAQGHGNVHTSGDGHQMKWPEGAKMAFSLTFDDARKSQLDHGVPILDKYDVKGTFYVSPDLLRKRLGGWKSAVESGHEIGNHSLRHPCTWHYEWAREHPLEKYTVIEMSRELDSANQIINNLLGITPVSFAYPCGQTTVGYGRRARSYVPLVSSMFETGRTAVQTPVDPDNCDLAQISSVCMDGKSFYKIKPLIEQAMVKGQWLVLHGHEIGIEGSQTTLISTLDSLCSFAIHPENKIWVDHVSSVGSYIKNRNNLPSTQYFPFRNPVLPMEQRIEDLLSRMTLEEKIGQLNMPFAFDWFLEKTEEEALHECLKFVEGKALEGVGPGGGLFALPNSALFGGPEEQAIYLNSLQRVALHKTRLGIPLLQTEEGTHGLRCSGGTIFPEGPALGSSWNLDLIGKVYETAAREARAIGIHQLFTLVVEPNRDPRMGRNQECYSEDPYQCARISKTMVKAIQGYSVAAKDKVIAGLCHFPGQSAPVSGLERGAMEISERMLREVFLLPWVAGIKEAGALGVMATYPTIDGIPTHSSEQLLSDLLRGELRYEGLVMSEGGGIETLIYTGLADSYGEAAAQSVNAGLDVCITLGNGFGLEMVTNVLEGVVSVETIDRSVRRVLEMKFRLGLFEDPFVDPGRAVSLSHTPENQELALQAGREGIVMLKNENQLLPLSKTIKSIAIIGPNADDERNQLGDYTSSVILQDVTTALEGIRKKLGKDAEINYVKGCNVIGNDLDEIDEAVRAAEKAEVAIVVLGENEWQKNNNGGTVGEGYDVATLELTGRQKELVQKVQATKTPTIVVLINGRPLAIPWIDENIPSILEAWTPGEKGGDAIADILFGDYNPSGKLTLTFPRHAGQVPVYYNHKPSKTYWLDKGWGNSYADIQHTPLYEFGYGLSYSTFEYSNLSISPDVSGPFGNFTVTADIFNSGEFGGAEVVQLYIRDPKSSVVRPVKELKGFDKVWLEPGQTSTVSFYLGYDELKMLDSNMQWIVEPGTIKVMIGSSSEEIRLEGRLDIR